MSVIEVIAKIIEPDAWGPDSEEVDLVYAYANLRACARIKARAILAAIEAAGFAVVPREPTEEMVEAGMAARKMAGQTSGVIGQTIENCWRHEFRHELRIWAAMLDAGVKS